ncbi:MAG: hypothetical protein WC668_02540 [Patescibacteria group bacterium]|jgi:hypothetical protein
MAKKNKKKNRRRTIKLVFKYCEFFLSFDQGSNQRISPMDNFEKIGAKGDRKKRKLQRQGGMGLSL